MADKQRRKKTTMADAYAPAIVAYPISQQFTCYTVTRDAV